MATIKKRERAVLGTVSFMPPLVANGNAGSATPKTKDTSTKSRRDQVLKAQRGHRQRSKDYMEALETEVLRLRTEASQLRGEAERSEEIANYWKDCLVAVVGPRRPQPSSEQNPSPLQAPGNFIWAVRQTTMDLAGLFPVQSEFELWKMVQMSIYASQMGIPVPMAIHRGPELQLLSHFCESVMPSLDITESSNYGYARHVIPLAMNSEMVRHAILAASAGHLEIVKASKVPLDALKYRSAAIAALRQASHHPPTDPLSRLSILATILGLLVDDMICGHREFTALINLADSWNRLNLPLGRQSSEADSRKFLQDQIEVMRSLVHPLYQFQRSLQPIQGSGSGSRSKRITEIFMKIETATLLACEIRSLPSSLQISEEDGDMATAQDISKRLEVLLDKLKSAVSGIPPFSLGENGLVWVCSIAASSSQKPHHKAFFTSHLAQLLRRIGHPDIEGIIASINLY